VYIESLNNEWIEKLQRYVEGKNVLLVGNATSLFSEKRGSLIDSYDVVLRFGKGVPYPQYVQYLGTKTNIWFFGTARAGMWKFFRDVDFRIHTISQLGLYKASKPDLLVPRVTMTGELVPYRDFFLAGNAEMTMARNREISGEEPGGARPSQGAEAVHFFVNQIKTQKALHLIGFDFFGSGFSYNYNDPKGKIPAYQPTTSWHCPLISKDYDENPHAQQIREGTTAEERYIRSAPGVYVHPMKPCDIKVMEKVMKQMRGAKNTQLIGELQ
jgi:hypothetical protein